VLYGVAQRNKYDLSVRNDEIVEGEISMSELAEENWGGVTSEAPKAARSRRRVENWEGLGEHRKLLQRAPGRSPGGKRVLVYFEL